MAIFFPDQCPFCKAPINLVSNSEIYGKVYGNGIVYRCSNLSCKASVGCHPNCEPLGIMATSELKILRKKFHSYFEKQMANCIAQMKDRKSHLLISNLKTTIYHALGMKMNIPIDDCHSTSLSVEQIIEANHILSTTDFTETIIKLEENKRNLLILTWPNEMSMLEFFRDKKTPLQMAWERSGYNLYHRCPNRINLKDMRIFNRFLSYCFYFYKLEEIGKIEESHVCSYKAQLEILEGRQSAGAKTIIIKTILVYFNSFFEHYSINGNRFYETIKSDSGTAIEGIGVSNTGIYSIAGPVVGAAVVLPEGTSIPGLPCDVSKLTSKSVAEYAKKIMNNAVYYSTFEIEAGVVDKLGKQAVSGALHGMLIRRAKQIKGTIRMTPSINGKYGRFRDGYYDLGLEKTCNYVTAAGILARFTYEKRMKEIARENPGYGLSKNWGYPTFKHLQAVKKLGAIDVHRIRQIALLFHFGFKIGITYDPKMPQNELKRELLSLAPYLRSNRSAASEEDMLFLRSMYSLIVNKKRMPCNTENERLQKLLCVIREKRRNGKGVVDIWGAN